MAEYFAQLPKDELRIDLVRALESLTDIYREVILLRDMEQLLGKSPSGLFATQTLTGHVIRGAVAFALLTLAIGQQHLHHVATLLAGLLALVAMRGCPVCWTIGLAETIRQRYGVTRSSSVTMKGRLE